MRIRSGWFSWTTAAAGVLSLIAAFSFLGAADDASPSEATIALLKTFVDEFIVITPGEGKFPSSFQMGSEDSDQEKPIHKVTFQYKFAMAKYEVSQNLYEAVMKKNPSRWKGPRNSVEKMSCNEATDFCTRTTELLQKQKLIAEDEVVRLPSEAEWEYCCRAGTTTRFSFGDDAKEPEFSVVLTGFGENKIGIIKLVREATGLGLKDAKDLVERGRARVKMGLSQEDADKLQAEIEKAGGKAEVKPAILLDRFGWFTGNAAGNDPPVGALQPNPWGLYDMHGYLWEFTADGWSSNYSKAPADGSSVKADQETIVLRSGSWKDPLDKLTSSARREYLIKDDDDAVGFRCVKAKRR